ncbi:SDR family NAD(P)-dependent oxidoreductase, partial [Kitasatospora sp. NPDC057198]|uniref:SDR family NAD(P)-dependent oxidoreductase n=1 Tax=Kitasatospora sp. NPDC057198 TaxID=3346046 RepID=UPI003641AB2D
REALAMDPQQRLLLELSWEAFERAGIDPTALRGSATGVFVGASSSGYGANAPEELEGHLQSGIAPSVISGRVAYTLGLEGPALTVDTACSSSLVALHLATQALRAGECTLALAGGVTVHATTSWLAWFSRQQGLAADGRCKAYSEQADGMGMAEGAAVVALERLSDARRLGHKVLAVVRGSAINQDGASNGLTAPNGPSQQRVIRAALANAGLSAAEVDVVEGHGTGTRLGDPIEAQALLATYGQDRPAERPLLLGSLKSNIGHTQWSSGVAGVIKTVLALQHEELPRTLHAEEPTSHVDWESGAVRLATSAVPWPHSDEQPRRAGVSSFGISGTNAHVIIEQAPAVAETPAAERVSLPVVPVVPWVVSGRSAAGLAGQAERLAGLVGEDLADVGLSLAASRAALEHRAVVLGVDAGELAGGLRALVEGVEVPEVVSGVVGGAGKLGFVFTGQGAQRVGMGLGLYEAFPVFAEAFDAVCAALAEHLDGSLAAVIRGEGDINGTGWAQPALFAVEVALFRLLESWGVVPQVVAGHSIGELAAAHVAGVWSLDDACAVVAARGRLMQQLPTGGAMVAVEVTEERALAAIADRPGVGIAAVNAPTAVVISGVEAEVLAAAQELASEGARTKRLQVSHAFHSPLMEPMLAEFARIVESVSYRAPRIPFVSALTGASVTDEVTDPSYWVRHVREAVRFSDAANALRANGVRTFVEIGPDGVLSGMGPQTATATATATDPAVSDEAWIALLRRGRDEPRALLTGLAKVFVRGVPVDWAGLFPGARRVDLPTYAFQHQRYWLTPVQGSRAEDLGLGTPGHPLLGAAVTLPATGGLVLTGRLSVERQPWLADHVVAGQVIVPGAALVELAVRAGDEAGCGRVEELIVEAPLVLPARGAVRVQVTVDGPEESGRRAVAVYAQPEDAASEAEWTRHATGTLSTTVPAETEGLSQWPPVGAEVLDLDGFYPALAAGGLTYGPAFRGIRAAWRRGDELFAEVALPEGVNVAGFGLHPALLDAALHVIVGTGERRDRLEVPFSWADVELHATGAAAARVRVVPERTGEGLALTLADASGAPIATVGSLVLRPFTATAEAADRDGLFGVEWITVEAKSPSGQLTWVSLGGGLPGAESYADLPALLASGAVPELVVAKVATPAGSDVSAGPDVPEVARGLVADVLGLVQEWLATEEFAGSRLLLVTERAVDAGPEVAVEPAAAPLWGLVRVAQAENPGRLLLADLDGFSDEALSALREGAASGEPQFAVRAGQVRVPRLARLAAGLPAPAERVWNLDFDTRGTLENLTLRGTDSTPPLGAGQVRVALRAAGVNFRDVLNVLDMYPGDAGRLGLEGAGTVLEVGPGVTGLRAGDEVMGLFAGAFATEAVTDHRLLAPVPPGWTTAEAAGAPLVYLTAWYALVELAELRENERVLIHAAAGGVGIAALQLARHLGAEVFATASTAKWPTVRGLGVAASHLASSRTTDFEPAFRAASDGHGMDVVLDSLAGEFVDASLRLTHPGGRFVEMGKTDVRDPAQVRREHDVAYRAFDLLELDPDLIGRMLRTLTRLFADGALRPLPVACWDVRHAVEAFRFLSQARHTGKVVLTLPRADSRSDSRSDTRPGTVLVTGASGALGGLVARHLAASGRAERLLLVSRRGRAAAGMAELVAEIREFGVEVDVVACDVADRAQLAEVLSGVPLTGVVHAAGVVDDGLTTALTPERVDAAMRPKADAAWHLHELTRGLDLDLFVLFSSIAGVWGNPGQANYAAGNTFLDALAAHRRRLGLPATSLVWGPWEHGMTAKLGRADWQRMARQGLRPLPAADGLAMLDAAPRTAAPLVVTAKLDLAALRRSGDVPPFLSGLVRSGQAVRPARRAADTPTADSRNALADRLRALGPAERAEAAVELVATQAALVLGMAGPQSIETARTFRDTGFDSLTSVELRNRLNTVTGLRLPATAVFDYPTPAVLGAFLLAELVGDTATDTVAVETAATAGAALTDQDRIAIVGIGCRFPGGVASPDEFWELVAARRDAVGPFPTDRGWPADVHDPDPDAIGKSLAGEGGFLYEAGEFDASFFGISPREAIAMDPQQRLLLETSWHALEDAGIDPTALRGSATGVFAGLIYHDYLPFGAASESVGGVEGYLGTGGSGGVASGRVSYALGLEGPAVTVDTACSSSLVALHLACQSLRSGESSLALAGGVNVMATPGTFIDFTKQGGLASDGRCKAYAESADGTGWGEGVGVLVLERLSDALRNGHNVLAVVAGSAVNQDGASNGLTAPNGPSQQRVIRAALANAGLSAAEVDVVEGHGTGTKLGDPIEAQALLATYGQGRPFERPLLLGSVKSNIGHAQAAAGVAGVIKMVAAMQRGVVPATLHVDAPSSHIDWEAGAVRLVTEAQSWPETGERPRRAGVSSFGFSGTNAHVIIEQAPAVAETPAAERVSLPVVPVVPWVVSGRSAAGLAGQAERLAGLVDEDLADVGLSLATARAALEHRAVVLGADGEELRTALAALAEGVEVPEVVSGVVGGAGKLGFVFTGQGAQRVGMGLGLYAAFPVFAEAFDAVCAALAEHLDGSLAAVIRGEGDINETGWAQPALFAVEVALFRLLESWGVVPQVVAGHSIGELAAAHVAGVWSLDDACAVVAARGRLMQQLPSGGAMVAVEVTEERALAAIADRPGVGIAAVNAPTAVVISGVEAEVLDAAQELASEGARTKRLQVSHAFHSPLMEPMLAEFAQVVESVSYRAPRIPFVSALTGAAVTDEVTDPSYWVRHVREAVRFADAANALRAAGVRTFVEIGPDGVLSGMGPQTATGTTPADEAWIALLRRGRDEPRALLTGLAKAFVRGVPVDWAGLFPGARRVDLPTYAFQHQRYWLPSNTATVDAAGLGQSPTQHPLLGAAVSLPATGGLVLTGRLSLAAQPWLADHVVAGQVIVPGAALLELAVRAGDEAGCDRVEELLIEAPLVLPAEGGTRVQVTVDEADHAGRRVFAVYSQPEDAVPGDNWTRHATGTLTTGTPADVEGLSQWPPVGAEALDLDGFYPALAAGGLAYGPAFRGVRAAWRRGDELFAEVALPEGVGVAGFGLHPALLDAALHVIAGTGGSVGRPEIPFAWSDSVVYAADAVAARVRVAPAASGEGVSVTLADASGAPIATVGSLVLRPVAVAVEAPTRSDLFGVEWIPAPANPASQQPTWVSLGGGLPGAESYADLSALLASGAVPELVVAKVAAPAGSDVPEVARGLVADVLGLLQEWLGAEEFAGSRLLLVTERAVDAGPEVVVEPVAAPVWGLVRVAQAENPGRLLLADLDGFSDEALSALREGVASGEPQFAVRGGQVRVPRLVRLPHPPAASVEGRRPGTVLVTGASGALGGLVARHLAAAGWAERLLLVSRRGRAAAGMAQLVAEIQEFGVEVDVVACDVADRAQLAEVLSGVPLTGVVHAAGAVDDALLAALTPERVEQVLRPKVDAAWHLHELTFDLDLDLFVLFSSVAGVWGNPGQANYAAGNTFLDALAAHRHALDLPAVSLAWGPWEQGMAADLTEADWRRLSRQGLGAVATANGLAMLDAAVTRPEPLLVAAELDLTSLQRSGEVSPLLSGLVRPTRTRRSSSRAAGDAQNALAARLAPLSADERLDAVRELVLSQAALVLGMAGPEAVGSGRSFRDVGFDSLTAVELRTRLNTATGLRLPATVVFDYPTPAALADFVLGELIDEPNPTAAARTAGPATRTVPADQDRLVIVGMACRFPGGVASPDEFWELLSSGGDAIGAFPTDRGWSTDLVDPDPDAVGKSVSGEGGFLYGAGEFDAEFFGISPREAVAMDPQQRLLLETSWHALEDAGIDPTALRGSATGVFAGLFYHDYLPSHFVPEEVEGYLGTGGTGSVASGRVSYTLGLEGPAVTVDTACSSSLVALHLACQSLRSGESSLALAGGVTVMATPGTFIDFSRQRGLASDGRCKAYAESADGTGWGEGVGMLVVERMSDALRNGHRILAVVAGSAVNQDGASNGLTAPNGPSQQRVIRAALANAGLSAAEVDVVEGHGTGTKLGDPIEAQALLATYGQDRPAERPLLLGSVKSNIGHAQAAAGAAGIIKMIAAMRNGIVPATLHAEEASSRIDWEAGAVRLVTEARPWPDAGHPRRAGVSSFGFSGTNAHVIIEQAPVVAETPAAERVSLPVVPVVPWVVSGRSAAGLAGQAERLAGLVGEDLADVGLSLATARAALEHRAVVLGANSDELAGGLRALAEGVETPEVVTGTLGNPGRLGFVFTGQGAQRVGMGLGLYEAFPVFAEAFDAVCAALAEHLEGSLAAVIRGEGEINETGWAQPALFAVEVALFRLLESWGVSPQVVAGHSIGELAAAHVAGVWSLDDACAVVAARGRLMQQLPTGGAMVAVEVTEERALAAIADRPGVGIAAVNAPTAVVISGVEAEVLSAAEELASGGARTKRLQVSHAFHSPLMEPMLAEFARIVESVSYRAPRIPFVSALTGASVTDEVTDPSYWVRHVREAVRFSDAANALRANGVRTFVEIGPDGVLSGMGPQTATGTTPADEAWIALLRRGRDEPRALLTGLARAFVRGVPVDWAGLFLGARRVDLPTYAFQHQRYWLTPVAAGRAEDLGLGTPAHPLLGAAVTLPATGGLVLTGRLSLAAQPWLADHAVDGLAVVPGAALVELAVRAGDETGCDRVEELLIEAPLVLPAQGAVRVQVTVDGPEESGRRAVAVYAQPEDAASEAEWTRHATGTLTTGTPADVEGLSQWPPVGAEVLELDGFYPALAAGGLAYGPAFRGVRAAWRRGDELFAEVALPEGMNVAGFGLHPALLDAALHVIGGAGAGAGGSVGRPEIPFAWSDAVVYAADAVAARVRVAPAASGEGVSVTLADASGAPIASVGAVVLRPFVAAAAEPARNDLFGMEWVAAGAHHVPSGGTWVSLGDGLPGTESYADLSALRASGTVPELVVARVVPEPYAADLAASAHRTAVGALALVQEWLGAEEFAGSRLLLVTERAVDAGPEVVVEPVAAPVWGLVRVAQAENPGRLLLADLDGFSDEALSALREGVASGEPQFAVRGGQVRVPRLVRLSPLPASVEGRRPGTVLVTGASGALGGLVARHLAVSGRVERLVLLSRRGVDVAGMPELVAELKESGVEVLVAACDVADREELAEVVSRVPLTGVVHVAGVLDDGVLSALTPERVGRVLRPKVDAAWYLHELTRDRALDFFVLFSSVAGVVGNPGQA